MLDRAMHSGMARFRNASLSRCTYEFCYKCTCLALHNSLRRYMLCNFYSSTTYQVAVKHNQEAHYPSVRVSLLLLCHHQLFTRLTAERIGQIYT